MGVQLNLQNKGEKTMKKSKRSVFVVAVMAILVLAVASMAGITLAKYVTTANLNAKTATVAKFGYTVSITDNLFVNEYVTNIKSGENDQYGTNYVAIKAKSDLLAPGASGSLSFTIDGSAEVGVVISVTATGTDIVLKEQAATASEASAVYNPVKWTLTKKASGSETADSTIVNAGTLADVVAELNKLSANVEAGGTYASAGSYVLSYSWAYSTTDNSKDAYDTLLGQIAAAENPSTASITIGTGDDATTYTATTELSISLEITVTQMEPSIKTA